MNVSERSGSITRLVDGQGFDRYFLEGHVSDNGNNDQWKLAGQGAALQEPTAVTS